MQIQIERKLAFLSQGKVEVKQAPLGYGGLRRHEQIKPVAVRNPSASLSLLPVEG